MDAHAHYIVHQVVCISYLFKHLVDCEKKTVISHPKFAVLLAKEFRIPLPVFSVSETVSNPKCVLVSFSGKAFVRKREELENFRTGNRSVRLDGGKRLLQTAGISVALSPSSSFRPHSPQTAILSQEELEGCLEVRSFASCKSSRKRRRLKESALDFNAGRNRKRKRSEVKDDKHGTPDQKSCQHVDYGRAQARSGLSAIAI